MDVFVELKAVISQFQAKMVEARGEMTATEKHGSSHFASLSKGAGLAGAAIAAGAAAVAVASVKMAGDFQQNMSKLVTSGGELEKNLGGDMRGVQKLMGQTGTSAQQLASGLYVINSAGFHGAAGLQVLKAAAEGAKTENADLGTVTDGLTTLMNDYHMKASQAALVTSKMVEATSLGKTTFQDLAGSLHTVAPAADAVGLSMNQVLGAMAEMTSKGTPAADAATYLRQTILQLANPSKKAHDEMAALGLSSIFVSKNLGRYGLTGTLSQLTDAIQSKMGPSGLVLINNLKQAAAAGSKWAQQLAAMTPDQQKLIESTAATGVAVDKLNTEHAAGAKLTAAQTRQISEYHAKLAMLPPAYKSVLQGAIANKLGFTDLASTVAKLPPAEQTQVAALANMVGGTKSMQAALELTGSNMDGFASKVASISRTTTEAGGHVAGWATVQKNFNQKLAEAKGTVEALGIKLGLVLIPILEHVAKLIGQLVVWFEKHRTVALALGIALGAMAAALIVVAAAMFIAGNAMTLGIGLAIGLLIVGIVYLATHWKQVWADIKQWTADAVNWIKDHLYLIAGVILGPFGLAIVWLGKHWREIWDAMKTVVRDFVGFFTGAGAWLTKAGKDVTGGLWTGLRWPWDHIIKPFFDGIKTLFVDFFTRGAGSWLIKGGKDVLSGLWAGIKAVWNATVAPWFRDIVRPIAGFFATAVTWLVKGGIRIITGMFNGIASVMRGAASWLTVNVFAPIVRFYAGALTWLLRAGGDIMRGLFNGLWSVVSTLGGWLMEHMLRPLMRFFALAVGWLFHAGGDIIAGLFHGIASAMANVGSWINSHVVQPVIHAVKHFFGIKSPSTLMMGVGVNVMEGFIAGLLKANPMKVVKKVFGSVAHGAKMIFDAAGGLASGLFGAIGGQQKIGLGGLAPGFKFGEPGGTALQNQAVAQQMAAAMGWTGIQWQALNNVEMREAGWSMTAKNPSSNAYGIAQFINGPGEYAQYGGNATTLSGQLIGFFNYIKQRYGTPDNAWAHEVAFGWYDQGGKLPPGLSLALNTTGRAEVVRPGPGSGGATYVLNFNGPVIGEGGMRAVARQLRVAIERDARAGTPSFVL